MKKREKSPFLRRHLNRNDWLFTQVPDGPHLFLAFNTRVNEPFFAI